MECCKEKKYDLHFRVNLSNEDSIKSFLIEQMGWTEIQSKTAIDFAKRRGSCVLMTDSMDKISKTTPKLAQAGISFEVKSSK